MIREAVSRLASTVSPSSSTLKRLSSPSTIVISVQAQTGLHRTQGSDNRVTCIQINQQIPMFFPSLFFPFIYFRDPLYSLIESQSFVCWVATCLASPVESRKDRNLQPQTDFPDDPESLGRAASEFTGKPSLTLSPLVLLFN